MMFGKVSQPLIGTNNKTGSAFVKTKTVKRNLIVIDKTREYLATIMNSTGNWEFFMITILTKRVFEFFINAVRERYKKALVVWLDIIIRSFYTIVFYGLIHEQRLATFFFVKLFISWSRIVCCCIGRVDLKTIRAVLEKIEKWATSAAQHH